MLANPLKTRLCHHAGIAVIELQGEINATAEPTLTAIYNEATASNPGTILLNLSNVEYITSTGMAILAGLLAQAHRTGHRLAAWGLSNHYYRVFQIARLTDFLEVFPDEASAFKQL